MSQRLILLVSLVILAFPVSPQELARMNRFQLWNDCEPMDLIVERLDDDAVEIGLTEESITVASRSRLRAAGLYDAEMPEYLYVQVSVGRESFSIDLQYKKVVYDPATEIIMQATTWEDGSFGTHGKDSGFILSAVSQKIDKFLDEYLRVNKDSCSAR